MWIQCNPNPAGKSVGDCVVRAVAIATDRTWKQVYRGICRQGEIDFDMPSSDPVWGAYLEKNGFSMQPLPPSCPHCYTVTDFCIDHPDGVYILGTGKHAVAVINGDYYDAWDSGQEVPIYFWRCEHGV